MADAPAQMHLHGDDAHKANAGLQGQGMFESGNSSTFLPVRARPEIPPNMRMWTRWQYVAEYIGYWKYQFVCAALMVGLIIMGFLSLNYFLPGALLMFAVAGRYGDLAWWYNFIVHRFGRNRTLVLVD